MITDRTEDQNCSKNLNMSYMREHAYQAEYQTQQLGAMKPKRQNERNVVIVQGSPKKHKSGKQSKQSFGVQKKQG